MLLILWNIIKMGHNICDNMKDYWSTTEQLVSTSYGKTMRHDRFVHILRFLSFSNNENASDNKA
jgi:hypothetical protein